ncbi:very short patch repair endonuclease [Teichococcus aestuarii]|uniref:very short patch repair endonuclease n=1 Tax=Teichococcus aestuarii TaxID=568898 RepID=UPI0036245EE0
MSPSATRERLRRPSFDDVSEARRRNLAAVRGKDTKSELTLRRLLHAMGYRYQLHRRDLPGRPDIVFPRHRVVVEVRGCFWHRHPNPACRNVVLPRARAEWWAAKLQANVDRDHRNEELLAEAGWRTIVVWECQVLADPSAIAARVATSLSEQSSAGRLPGEKQPSHSRAKRQTKPASPGRPSCPHE